MAKRWKSYHTLWTMLFLGWVVSYIDRQMIGPIVTWMIENDTGFLASAANPHALGGLMGTLFFAGYMLTQFPGGYFGDKYGNRNMILISIFWAGITTLVTGLFGGLLIFVALRILTGLGEGTFYSNDRALIARNTPPKHLGLGLGVVISGLTVGLTIGLLGTPYLLKLAGSMWGEEAWKAPFAIMGVITIIVGFFMKKFIKDDKQKSSSTDVKKALVNLSKYSITFLIIIMAIYYTADTLNLSKYILAGILLVLALAFIFYIYKTKKEVQPILKDRNLLLLYISAIPILWHLWFYGFWSVSIIKDLGGSGLLAAGLVASFNGIAGILGFPLGGALSDRMANKPNGRKITLLWLTGLLALSVFAFTFYLISGPTNLVVMSIILFISGLFFFAMQSVHHALTAEIAPEQYRGSAFGMWNLIAEIGGLLSPIIAGALRDTTGGWGVPLMLDAILLGVSFLLIFFVGAKYSGSQTVSRAG